MTEPTDLELMMYADGELDPERAAEVGLFLGADAAAADKLFGMAVVSAHVQREADRVATAHRADDIVAGVLDAIRAQQSDVATAKTNGRVALDDRAVVSLADRRSETGKASAQASGPAAPANDNARLIYGLAGLAAAAAIALGVWGQGASPAKSPVDNGDKVAIVSPEDEPSAPADPASTNEAAPQIGSNKKPPPPVQDDTPAVAVAAVDFGTKTGAVYYVPSDSPGATTTVVWVSDE